MNIIIRGFIWGILFPSLLGGIIVALIIKYSNIVSKNYLEDKNISHMKNLFELHEELINSRGFFYSVKGFSLEYNTLAFRNLGTNTSYEGNCFGFAFLVNQIFSGKLIKTYRERNSIVYDLSFINKNLSKYELDYETAVDIYKDDKNSRSNIQNQYDCQKPTFVYKRGSIKLLDPRYIYKIIYKHPDVFTKYKKNARNTDVVQILKAIEFYQAQYDSNRRNFKLISSLPCVYKEKIDAISYNLANFLLNWDSRSKYKRIKRIINIILDKLCKNELVILGIYNNTYNSGHAVLAYKYEKIDAYTIKVYVYDSNIPLMKETDEESTKINEDIKNKAYILFKNISHKWQYVYSPIINGNYIYQGIMNSYVPDTLIRIIEGSRKYNN